MIIDNHVHTGWFKGTYFSAEYVWKEISSSCIDHVAVSSLSGSIKGFHKLAIREIKELQRLSKNHVSPLLWVIPSMFKPKGEYELRELLHSGIEWKGIKIHYYMHPEWNRKKHLAVKAFELVRKMQLPVLAHTGGSEDCDAWLFEDIAKQFPDVTIVLAHGRPIGQAIHVLKECPNTLVDTAFMPKDDQKLLIENGFAERMLFGTDVPINKYYYPNMSTKDFVQNHLEELRSVTTQEQYDSIVNRCAFK